MKLMKPAIENQLKCHEYLEELQPTIDRTVERQGNVLEKRYQSIFNALERANNNLVKYKDSLESLKNLIDKSDQMQLSLMDVENYKNYSYTLIQDINKLQSDINEYMSLGGKLKKIVTHKHKQLTKMNFNNLIYLREINNTRKQISHQNHKIEQLSQDQKKQSAMQINETLSDEDQRLLQQIDNLKQNNKMMKYQITQTSNNYFQKISLFTECMNLFRKQLEKSQRVVNTNQGMQGSLLFEMKKAKLFLTESEVQSRYNNKSKSQMQGRQITSLIHDTLKGMLEDREGKRAKYLKDFNIEWDAFKQFNPVQLLGVMSLKPKIFDDLINVLEFKARIIKEEIHKHKSTSIE